MNHIGEVMLQNVNMGDFVSIGSDVTFHGPDNHACVLMPELVSSFDFPAEWNPGYQVSGYNKGRITIGNDVLIGRGVKVLSGVKIGDGAVIGAWSVVAKDIPPYAIAVGNPVVVKKYRFAPEVIEKLLRIRWWEWTPEIIISRMGDFRNIDIFIQKYG